MEGNRLAGARTGSFAGPLWWARGELVRGELVVAIFVELGEGSGRGGDFSGRQGAIVVGVQRRDERRRGATMSRSLRWTGCVVGHSSAIRRAPFGPITLRAATTIRRSTFGTISIGRSTFRALWPQFVAGQLAVTVLIQGCQGGGCSGDFPGGNHLVMIRVEQADEGRWRTRRWALGIALWLGGGDRSGEEGEQGIECDGLHFRLWYLVWIGFPLLGSAMNETQHMLTACVAERIKL